jgi:hypothetical protein
MMADFSIHYLRFHLEPNSPLHVLACLRATHRQAYSKGNVIGAGLGARFDGSCVVEIYKAVFVDNGSHSATGDLRSVCP